MASANPAIPVTTPIAAANRTRPIKGSIAFAFTIRVARFATVCSTRTGSEGANSALSATS
jgi:hypothetical protein